MSQLSTRLVEASGKKHLTSSEGGQAKPWETVAEEETRKLSYVFVG